MKLSFHMGLLVALLCGAAVHAESLPTFHLGSCTHEATHIVVVKTETPSGGEFRVLGSWKGDLEKGSLLKLPALAKDARGEMVLFLRHDPKRAADDQWQSASIFKDWQTSVAWLDGDKVTTIQQPRNPGPAYATTWPEMESRKELKDGVLFYLQTEQAFAKARVIQDVDKRVEALTVIVNGRYDRKEEAFAALAECGKKAVPSLRKFLEGPANHQQKYAIAAMAKAGGKEVVGELNTMLEGELAYWKKTGPTLEKGWWFKTDGEPWKRFGNLMALLGVYGQIPTPVLRNNIVAARDFFRTLPAIDDDTGIGSISEYCDRLLKGGNE
jgi:hypothetical protein